MHLRSKYLRVPDAVRRFIAFFFFFVIREAIDMKNVGSEGDIFMTETWVLTTRRR